MRRLTEQASMYSLMSMRTIARSSSNRKSPGCGQLGLADAGRPEEQEPLPIGRWVRQKWRGCDGWRRTRPTRRRLADDPLVQRPPEADERHLASIRRATGTRSAGDDLGDVLSSTCA